MSKRKRAEDVADGKAFARRSKKSKTKQPETLQGPAKGGAELSFKSQQLQVGKKQKLDRTEKLEKKSKDPEGAKLRENIARLHHAAVFSAPTGGRLLDVDPIFSEDEEYLILAYASNVKIYSNSTSLLVRILTTRDTVVACSLSACEPSQIYIAIGRGRIEHWDWVVGKKLATWDLGSVVSKLCVASLQNEEGVAYDVIIVADITNGRRTISAHSFQAQEDGKTADVRTLYDVDDIPDPISQLHILRNGQIIVATAGKQLIVGARPKDKKAAVQSAGKLRYVWRQMQCSASITAISSRIPTLDQPGTSWVAGLDIALGTSDGTMFLYRDFLTYLIQVEQKKQAISPATSRLHWHRNAVGSVKWSLDGNYLISGGIETVMVIWQLDTGKKQLLPHLSSAIESIVVSPSGASYGVRLADNSVMVLSTLELEPIANISGMQLPVQLRSSKVSGQRPGRQRLIPDLQRPAAFCTTSGSSQLLFAVPANASSRSSTNQSLSSPYLQMIDPRTGHSILKQALARTKVTDRNMGPEGNVIEEPNVILMSVSCDGKWMATVDEWMPSLADAQQLHVSDDEAISGQRKALETYLKFWSWSDSSKSWELVWKVDGPHRSELDTEDRGYGQVLDMVQHPSKAGFYTLGDDGLVKSWLPSSRSRNGIQVRDKDKNLLASWTSRTLGTISDQSAVESKKTALDLTFGKVCVSQDGSLLAAALDRGLGPIVRLINLQASEPPQPCLEQLSGTLCGMCLVDKYLVLLSDHLLVWDLVNDAMSYSIRINDGDCTRERLNSSSHLVADQRNGTFAVSRGVNDDTIQSRIVVFDPSSSAPLLVGKVPCALKALFPAPGKNGYYTVDSGSEIRLLTIRTSATSVSSAVLKLEPVEHPTATFAGLETVFGGSSQIESTEISGDLTGPRQKDLTSNSRRLIAQESSEINALHQHEISELFNANQALSLPPITTMFEQVASLVSRKVSQTA